MSISNAVGSDRVSPILGYKLTKGNFSETTPNLPQRVAIIGEVNDANQSGLTADVAFTITSAQQAGQKAGYGSLIHQVARIIFPLSGDGIGGIPVDVYPQAAAVGATARIQTITVTGTATAGGTHYLSIDGRTNIDGVFYAVNIASGDSANTVTSKINDAVNAVLSAPVTSALGSPPANVASLTTKWKGKTAQSVNVQVLTNNQSLGLTYVVAEVTAGTGTPSIAAALNAFGNIWYTQVCSCYGAESAIMDSLEATNGIPDPDNPTGRFSAIIMKPFIALIGSTVDDPSTLTDGRKLNCTIAICPAPASKGLPAEAAANYAVLYARQAQDTPELDISGYNLPDMPVPSDGNIGSMASYAFRDSIVKKGCSTADLVAGVYHVEDFVTTYHPDGETPPQYRYVRSLTIDMNVFFAYYLDQQINVVGHVIANDSDDVSATKVIKPKQWRQIMAARFKDLAKRALISDPEFSVAGLQVGLSAVNPDRLETAFPYKRSSFMRIASTTAQAGFNFGKV